MDDSLKQILAEQFAKLPKAVQRAIGSADVEKEMRALAERHKLHLDQWQLLENEVFMAILGIKPAQDIVANITKEVGISQERAQEIVADITHIVFEPIREELERELGAPQAREEQLSDIEKLRRDVLAEDQGTGDRAQGIEEEKNEISSTVSSPEPIAAPGSRLAATPATPPPPPPTEKIPRAPASGAYIPGQPSTDRTNVVDDPYREAPL